MPRSPITKAEERKTRQSLFLGMTIWFLHLNIMNALTSLSCEWNWFSFTIAGVPGVQFVEGLVNLIAVLAMLFMIYLPWRNWREFQSEKSPRNPQMLEDTEEDRRPLMAFVAMLLNGFFLLFMLATFVPMFAFNACGSA